MILLIPECVKFGELAETCYITVHVVLCVLGVQRELETVDDK